MLTARVTEPRGFASAISRRGCRAEPTSPQLRIALRTAAKLGVTHWSSSLSFQSPVACPSWGKQLGGVVVGGLFCFLKTRGFKPMLLHSGG